MYKILFAWVFFATPAMAAFDYLGLKGLHYLVHPNCTDVNLFSGLAALESNSSESMRFAGNYGAQTDRLGCNLQIPVSSRSKDCPQDGTAAFVQHLFPSPAGDLIANQGSDQDPASQLSVETIGKILNRIRLEPRGTLIIESKPENGEGPVHRTFNRALVEDLIFIVVGRHPDLKYLHEIQDAEMDLEDKQIQKDSCSREDTNTLLQLKQDMNEIKVKMGIAERRWRTEIDSIINSKKAQQARPFVESILSALHESSQPNSIYPFMNVPNQLMAYALSKMQSKSDVLSFYREIPGCLLEQYTQYWLQDSAFNAAEYRAWKNFLIQDSSNQAAISTETAALMGYASQVYDSALPPLAKMGKSTHKHLRGTTSYSDCAETALRNLLNIFVFERDPVTGESKLNARLLARAAEHHHLSLIGKPSSKNPNYKKDVLLNFYQKHSLLGSIHDQRARDDWSKIVSNLQHSTYKKGGNPKNLQESPHTFELKASLDNFLTALSTLVGDPTWTKLPEYASTADLKKNRKRGLDRLATLMSRENFILEWTSDSGKDNLEDTGQEIQFSINGKPAFAISFGNGHVHFKNIEEGRQELAKPMVKRILTDPGSYQLDLALPWYIDENNFSKILIKNPHLAALGWHLELRDDTGKYKFLSALKSVNQLDRIPLPLLQNWISNSSPDIETQVSLMDLLFEQQALPTTHPSFKEFVKGHILQNPGIALNHVLLTKHIQPIHDLYTHNPALLDARTEPGQNILHTAANSSYTLDNDRRRVIETLVRLRPSLLTEPDPEGKTPIDLARQRGQKDLLEIFQQN